MTYVQCQWWTLHEASPSQRAYSVRCTDEATHITIYGCIAQHVNERAYCPEHLYKWESQVYDNKRYCDGNCLHYVELWEKVSLNKVTLAYKLDLAARTSP